MPIIGGGGGPAAGTYIPVADSAGVTVDSTTYNDTIAGSGKLTTLIFPADQSVLAVAISGDAYPRIVMGADPNDYGVLLWGDGTYDPATSGAVLSISGSGRLLIAGHGGAGVSPGFVITNQTTAPADAILDPSEMLVWFDDTNGVGNTKLMVKGKSADGTVKTAAIVLA